MKSSSNVIAGTTTSSKILSIAGVLFASVLLISWMLLSDGGKQHHGNGSSSSVVIDAVGRPEDADDDTIATTTAAAAKSKKTLDFFSVGASFAYKKHQEQQRQHTKHDAAGESEHSSKQKQHHHHFDASVDTPSMRFLHAYLDFKSQNNTDSYSRQVCGSVVQLGGRGPKQTVSLTGSTCEAFIARPSVMILEKLVRRTMNVLEFSSGSSTLWYLLRVRQLTSIEHHEMWLQMVGERVKKITDIQDADPIAKIGGERLVADWIGYRGVCKGQCLEREQDASFRASYVNITFLKQRAPYDLVSIDGRGRAHCLESIIASVTTPGRTPLLSKHGIIVMDNTQRRRYWPAMNKVPKSWARVQFMFPEGERTTIWLRCDEQNKEADPTCAEVAAKLHKFQDDAYTRDIEISGDGVKTW